MKRGEERGRAAAAALLPLLAYEPECFACIVSHTKLSALAAADACRPAAPSQSPDGALPQGLLLLSRCFTPLLLPPPPTPPPPLKLKLPFYSW